MYFGSVPTLGMRVNTPDKTQLIITFAYII